MKWLKNCSSRMTCPAQPSGTSADERWLILQSRKIDSICLVTKPSSTLPKLIGCSPELAALPDAVDAVSLGAEMPSLDGRDVGPDAVRDLGRVKTKVG